MRSLLSALIVVVILFLAWTSAKHLEGRHHHQNCFRAEEMQDRDVPTQFLSRMTRLNHHSSLQLVPVLENIEAGRKRHERHHKSRCPNLQARGTLQGDVNERSLSPWIYHIDVDENRYPRKLAFAECLCNGCIDSKTGGETTSLNSKLVVQERMVLQRKVCQDDSEAESTGFTFEVKYIKVPVACTCVLPLSSG